jgi:predicted phage tail protein
MNQPTRRHVVFHGKFEEKYGESLDIGADSMFTFCSLLFIEIFPELKEEAFTIVLEDDQGRKTDLFDPEQKLLDSQKTIHIIPNPDGAFEPIQIVYAILVMIASVGVSLLLAPKPESNQVTASGSNFDSVENVVGQGGVIPVALGTGMHGSRVVSHGIDSTLYVGSGARYG